jgi:hypothetical protein
MRSVNPSGTSSPSRAVRSRWLHAHNGQGLLVLVAVVIIGILSALGGQTSRVFDQVNCTLAGNAYHQDNGNGNSNKCR